MRDRTFSALTKKPIFAMGFFFSAKKPFQICIEKPCATYYNDYGLLSL